MTKNQLKNETNILALLYMQLIYRLFREQQTILALYLINLSSIVSASAGSDEISETVDSGGSNCKKEALNEDKTAKFCSGLYYYNARWYDPNLGRFTTEDPIRDGLNWYIYANNNPLRFVDPTGLESADAAYSQREVARITPKPTVNPNSQKVRTQHFVSVMRSLRGTPYLLGGETREGTDCSGSINLALTEMGFDPGNHSAEEMASGELDWIDIEETTDSSKQGEAGILNFYSWSDGDNSIDHVNVGVGKDGAEPTAQVIDATEGDWMIARNENELQLNPAEVGTLNQTYSPYSYNTEPTAQGSIDFSELEQK